MENKYDDFEGPTDEELTKAYRGFNKKRAEAAAEVQGKSSQSSGQRWIGTPRHAKHKQHIGNVRVR